MKNKKGFTLVELLAVIVVLGVIMVIATTNVMKSINDSKNKAKYIAAKEIVEIASAYMYENSLDCINVETLINNDYLENDVTNPKTGENGNMDSIQRVCKASVEEQSGYDDHQGQYYDFNGYKYYLK